MPDYIYLLENRLSQDQRNALRMMREAAGEAEMILFLTGDAVRDLTSGHAVRDMEVTVQGNALKLKKTIEKIGGKVWGEDEDSQSLYLCFPGTVRLDVASAHSVEYKKPGQPTYHQGTIQDDLRRRDFTVNAMAISLNEGSYGLLMDPLNGAADIEMRTLRLVSNYGFLEEPSLLIRATRYKARLMGWDLDPRSQQRYENAKEEDVMQYLSSRERSRELEQIGHEDDGLKVLQALEAEGWMKVLCSQWTSAKADEPRLKALHDLRVELLLQGVHADMSAAQMQLLTAKMAPKDLAGLKKSLLRPGFVEEWNSLDALAAGFAKVLLAKENQTPSASYKLFMSYDPEAILWLGFTSKDSAVKERFNNFLKVWPETRQRIPYALMQEMRIRPELPNYNEILQAIFLELIDGKLSTPEEMRAFLEPYSPPAPPPQVTVKRPRGRRAEAKVKDTFEEDEEEGVESDEEDLDDMGGDEDEIELELPKIDLEPEPEEEEEEGVAEEAEPEDEGEEEEEVKPAPAKRGAKPVPAQPAKVPEVPEPAKAAKAPAKAEPIHKAEEKHAPAAKHAPEPKHAAKPAPAAKHTPAKTAHAAKAKPAAPAKAATKTPVKKAALKPHTTKPAHKSVPKVAIQATKAPAAKPAPAKPAPKAVAKPKPKPKPHQAAKPAAKKPAKKR